jgi:FkbM family methyltransferase
MASPAERRLVESGSGLKARGEELLGRAAFRAASSSRIRQLAFNALRLGRASVSRLTPLPELQFLAYVFGNVERSQAQILQDLWVCWELGQTRNGYFVEFGATDGVTHSNTALLEREYGWHGILAEPNPAWHRRLRQNRHADIDPRCLAARTGEQVEFLVVEEPELSTIATYAGSDHFSGIRRRGQPISVETVALNDLLDAHQAPETIDYMSIDTEGSECEILSTFDFDRWRVRLFSIEHNNTDREAELDGILALHGYRRVFAEFSQWDGWYRLDLSRDPDREPRRGHPHVRSSESRPTSR